MRTPLRAENETRTRDPNLGKVVLYQLSYFRNAVTKCGAENETRTRDPNLGKVVLYQLSYFRNYRNRSLFLSIAVAKVWVFRQSTKLFQEIFYYFYHFSLPMRPTLLNINKVESELFSVQSHP